MDGPYSRSRSHKRSSQYDDGGPGDDSNGRYKRYQSSSYSPRGGPPPPPRTPKFMSGEIVFRILCPESLVGSIIGKGGSIVKNLRQETGARITIQDAIPGSEERVVLISSYDGGEREVVCPAQEALFRVHSRIFEGGIEEEGLNRNIKTRLVVPNNQVGCLLGKGGKIIEQMREETKAQIRVLPRDQLPLCTLPSDEIVQVAGELSVVKKALSLISSRLKGNPPRERERERDREREREREWERGQPSPSLANAYSPDRHIQSVDAFPVSSHAHEDGSLPGIRSSMGSSSNRNLAHTLVPSSSGHMLSEVVEYHSRDYEPSFSGEELVFRILCPNKKIGSVIGRAGSVIKSLQDDIGAKIKITDPVPGSDERIIIISANEVLEDNLSPAQEALLHIQSQIVDLGPDKDGVITTKLLIPSNQTGCLLGKGGAIISEMRKQTRANIRILLSIDTVIIFDSDWNPISDIRALQKIHIDNQVEYLKVFRFYCPYTVEERVLIYAKQDYLLDNSLENFSATVCHLLLRWGVAHLFEKYEKLHDVNDLDFKLTSVSRNENLKSLSQDMLTRARDIAEIDNTPANGIIAKVPWEGRYGKGVPLLGESDSQLTAEKIPTNIFWTKLLKGRCIKKHGTTGQMQRPRRKVQYYEGSPTKSVSDSDDVEAKKKRRRVCGTLDPISISSWLKDAKKSLASEKEITENNIHLNADGAKQTSNESVKDDCGKFSHPMCKKSITDMLYGKHPSPCSGSCDADTEVAGSDCETINGKSYRETPDGGYKRSLSAAEDALIIKEHGHSLPHGFLSASTSHGQELSGSGAAYDSANPEGFVSGNTETEDGNALHVAEQSLHNRIKPDLVKLCKMLQLPEAVKRMAEEFLSYVTNDYFLPKETTSFVQAVEISLCWAAAESLKYNIDLEKSLELANVHLNFECKRVEVDSVYLKLRKQCLKLSRDIPHSTEQSGSGINIMPGYSASQQHDDEMFLQDDRVSTSRSNDNIKSSMQTTSIQEPISTHNSSRLDDDQQVRLDTTQNTEMREMDSQYQAGLVMSEQENSEAIGTGNTQDVEKNLNPHPKQYLVDQATNQANVILLDEVGVSNSPSGPGVDILSECQQETLSPGKVKWLKERIQVRKHARLRQQQAEVAEFFTHRDNERKRLQASQSMECNGIQNTYSDPEIRNAKLREKNLLHAQVAAQLEERLKKELEDLKKKQAAIREKENRIFSMCLEHINSGKISRYHSDIIESGSIPEDLESVLQSSTGEACDPVGIILPSPTETERLILASTSEQQANASPSESLIICPENQVSSELLGDQQNQQVDEQTACHMSNLPQTEMDNFHSTSRSRPSLERSRSRLRMLSPYQSDQVRPSPDSQQLHPNQHSFLQPDISPLSVGTGEQYNQDCDDQHVIQTQELNATQRSQQECLDNTSVCSPSSVPMMPIESSQPPQVIDMSERLSATTETSMFLNGLTRGNEPFQVSQFVASNNAQIHISAPSRSVQTNVPDPLYHEMLRIRKEQERIRKLHEEENTRIRVQFEKELEELKRRYTTLLQEEDYTFAQKKRILETNFIKVDMNRRLAEAFKIKVHDNNFTVPLVHSGSATQLQQPRQQALPASSVRLSQLATPLVHTVPAMIPPEISTSCSLPPVSGEQAGGMLSLHSNTQSDARSLGLARRFNHCMTLQNTQLGQAAQGISLPHNLAIPDISSRNIQPSGCPGSIALGGVAAETRMQAQGNTGEIISNAHLPDMYSVTSQRLQQHEIGHFLSSPNRSSSSGSLISSCNPLNQSQGNHLLHNTFSLANAQRANLPTVSACGVVEVGTQAIADIAVGNLQSPFPLALGACLGETPGMPQLSSSNLQQTNSSSIVENFISTEVQQATQEGVLLENNGEVGASFVYGNNASNPPVLTTETASVAPELEVSHSPLLVPAQSNCNTMTHCSSTPSVIYLSDDD